VTAQLAACNLHQRFNRFGIQLQLTTAPSSRPSIPSPNHHFTYTRIIAQAKMSGGSKQPEVGSNEQRQKGKATPDTLM